MKKYVYLFNEGSAKMKHLLGGKGANLAEMTKLNIPVPYGFTITTEACVYYINHKKYPKGFKKQVLDSMNFLEKKMKQKFGNKKNPMLVSVRSGARQSMPGMMETVLNVGLTNDTIVGLMNKTQNGRFAYDSYRRLITMYADVVLDKSNGLNCNVRKKLELFLLNLKAKHNIDNDYQLTHKQLKEICEKYKNIVFKNTKMSFPDNPEEQLWGSIEAVFHSWNGDRAKHYRKIEKIPDNWGTAVNVQVMVFGNMNKNSATGVAFTRNPSTGENKFFGEWLPNAQGEDVVAGIRTPYTIGGKQKNSLECKMPSIYKKLFQIQKKLEKHYKDMQDIEFTVENQKLWILQTRKGKRNGIASIKIALDLQKNKTIDIKTMLNRIHANHINELLHPTINAKDEKQHTPIAWGLPAGPGAATGQVVFDADVAEKMCKRGFSVVLVRDETSPEDVRGMFVSKAILTSRGGMTSHAALVARGWGKCCIVGAQKININYQKKSFSINNTTYNEMDWLTLNGSTGAVYDKQFQLIKPLLKKNKDLNQLIKLCNRFNNMLVRTNADQPKDVLQAKFLGAKGIGLCRTEHMFFHSKRIHEIRKMIISNNDTFRQKVISKLLNFQKKDFYQILKNMSPHPVTIRLLDPPLHEFLPHEEKHIRLISKDLNVSVSDVKKRIENLKELNPMLGHRGCRLGITLPAITQMQATAIFEAAFKLKREKIKTKPEIMIPFISTEKEFVHQKNLIKNVAHNIKKKYNISINYSIGTMIELPRACFIADKIAEHADFISFGTNDLTQTTFGFSRDDIGSFLPYYIKNNILTNDPFSSIDTQGVGELIKIAVQKARKVNPNIKIGICGEHGGDSNSIKFFNDLNFDYISCSPYRIPIAYLAVAQNNC